MPSRFNVDRKGIAELLVGPEMHELSMHFAREAKAFAIAISPEPGTSKKWSRLSEAGSYADKFEIHGGHVENLTKRFPTRRACADLVNTARYAEAVEQGWQAGIGLQPERPGGYMVLTQTAIAIGDPFVGNEP